MASNCLLIDELERSWKEVVVVYLRQYSGNYLQGLRKITKDISCLDGDSNRALLKYKLRALQLHQPA